MAPQSAILVLGLVAAAINEVHGFASYGSLRPTRVQSLQVYQDVDQAKATPLKVKIAGGLINALFSIKPLFKMASNKARSSMVERGAKIGVDWVQNVGALEKEIEQLTRYFEDINSKVVYPEYYLKPFHAYDDGNLSWQAAMEVESAALTVHAPIYTADRKGLDINGDFLLRDNFHKMMRVIFDKSSYKPKKILDIGCSTGLSTLQLLESFPEASVVGIDLSPYMLAVGMYNLKTKPSLSEAKSRVTYLHAAGESTGLGQGDVDTVTMSLTAHELPAEVSKQIFEEAWRVLPSGGAIAIMDMNPRSNFFQEFTANPFAFAAFKSTEPWLDQYFTMDLEGTLRESGFNRVEVLENSPRHRTVVGYK